MWEYKVARLAIDEGSALTAMEEQLNQLGQDGWEVVSVLSTSDVHSLPTGVICKREKK